MREQITLFEDRAEDFDRDPDTLNKGELIKREYLSSQQAERIKEQRSKLESKWGGSRRTKTAGTENVTRRASQGFNVSGPMPNTAQLSKSRMQMQSQGSLAQRQSLTY